MTGRAETSAVIVSNYGVGGSCLYLRQLAAAMKRSGFPVTFYVPDGTDMGDLGSTCCRYMLAEPSTHPSFLRLKLLKYTYHLAKYFYNALVVRPGGAVKVVHLLFPFYLTDLLLLNRLKRQGKKVVLTVHEVFPHRPFLGGKADRSLIREVYGKADILLAHTQSLKKELVETFSLDPGKIYVVPHGCFDIPPSPVESSTLKKKYGVPPDRKVLLFFGNIRENKGLDILLEAMKGMKGEYFLLVTGETAGASEMSPGHYRSMMERYGLVGSVLWIEKYISDSEAAEFFKIADAVVLPYKRSFHAQSGVLNLAAGFGRPCVVSDVGGLGELVREYALGVVVEPEDADALGKGIADLFGNIGSTEYGFQKFRHENSWDSAAEKYIEIYRMLLGS